MPVKISIRMKIAFFVMITAAVIITIFGTLIFAGGVSIIKEYTFSMLTALADARKDHIETLLEGYLQSVVTDASRRYPRGYIMKLSTNAPDTEEFRAECEKTINDAKRSNPNIMRIDVIDSAGKIAMSTDPGLIGANSAADPSFVKGIEKGCVGDIHLENGRYNFGIGAPLYNPYKKERETVGVYLVHMDSTKLFEELSSYSGLMKTGEIALARQDGDSILYINPLRNMKDSALKLRIPKDSVNSAPMRKALGGNNGLMVGSDYRGIQTLSAYRFIPLVGWGMTVKIDTDDAFADIRKLFLEVIGFCIIIFAVVFAAVIHFTRLLSGPINEINAAANSISMGNFKTKIRIKSSDEIGQLAGSFNIMAEKLQSTMVSRDALAKEAADRKLAESIARSSKDYLDKIMNSVGDPIFVKDQRHNWVLVNDAFCSFIGHERGNIIGRSDYEFFPKSQADTFWKKDEEVLLDGIENINEELLTDAKGATKTIVTRKNLYVDKLGKKFIVGVIRDITDRKKAEEDLKSAYEQLRLAQAKLLQSSKMAAVGQLSGGVAHEINNPLTGILNNVELIRVCSETNRKLDPEDLKGMLGDIESSAIRCKNITKALFDYSRVSSGEPKEISLNSVVQDTMALIFSEMKLESITLQTALYPGLPKVNADPQLLQQCLLSMISNSKWAIEKKALKTGGLISLRTRDDPENSKVVVTISDNGIGIPKDNIAKIFEPFFTTKDVGEGIGLGLSLAYSIIKAHNGSISVESRAGEGATFFISIPYK